MTATPAEYDAGEPARTGVSSANSAESARYTNAKLAFRYRPRTLVIDSTPLTLREPSTPNAPMLRFLFGGFEALPPGAALCVCAALTPAAMAGCDRVEILAHVAGTAGHSGTSPGSAGEAGSRAVAGIPVLVQELSDPEARDTDPTFTDDRLEIYFMSDRTGGKDLWRSTRDGAGDDWNPPLPVNELNSTGGDENPHVSNDGLHIWFFTDRDRARGALWYSTRASRLEPWQAPEPVPELTTGEGSSDVALAVDDSRTLCIVSSKRAGSQPYGLYRFERAEPDESFGTPTLLEEVVSSADEYDPDLRSDGRVLAFHSLRLGNSQLFWTSRPTRRDPFATPQPLAETASEHADAAPALAEDLSYLMFSSDRSGNSELYELELAEPLADTTR